MAKYFEVKSANQEIEQAKHIPECLSADIIKNEGSVEEIAQMIPTLDKLIQGLKQQ